MMQETKVMNIFPTKILLATDGSEDAAVAARAAVALCNKTDSELHVVHAWRFVAPYSAYPSEILKNYTRLNEQAAQELLARQVSRIEEIGGTVTNALLREGPPTDEILSLGEELQPGLIMIGSRGLGSVGSLLVGSVSEGVVHHASCPVLVVRGGQEAWPPQRIVIADDGSDPAKRAGELAGEIAKLFGSDTILVRAYEDPTEPIGGWGDQDRRKLDEALLQEERALEERAKALEAVGGSRPERRLIETEPTLAMLLVAEEKEEEEKALIALGSRGLGAAQRVMLGSVSTKILRVASGPVLVCPPGRRTNDG
jgi:nucleotide-binding universal stress UspA family protein